jgi:hypothetical protein
MTAAAPLDAIPAPAPLPPAAPPSRGGSPGRRPAELEGRPMTDPLARVRAQKALVERLTAERDAVQAKANELAGLVDAAEDDYIRELIAAYDGGVTPQVFFERLGMRRGSLHWRMNKLNGKGR